MFWKYNDNKYMKKVEKKLSSELDLVKIVKNQRALKLVKNIVFRKHQIYLLKYLKVGFIEEPKPLKEPKNEWQVLKQ